MGPCLLRFFIDMVWGAGIILHCAVSTSLPRASRAQASAQTGQKEALPRPPHSQASAQTVKKQPYTGAQTALSQPFAIPLATRNVTRGDKPKSSRHAMGGKGRQSKIISAQRPSIQTPWETREAKRDKGKQSKIISAQPPDTLWETRGDKSSQPSVQTRHGDKERQSKAIPPQHPDTPWETRGDEGKIISAQRPDTPWETKGDKEKQSKANPRQHPDTPWETRGDKGVGSILAPGN